MQNSSKITASQIVDTWNSLIGAYSAKPQFAILNLFILTLLDTPTKFGRKNIQAIAKEAKQKIGSTNVQFVGSFEDSKGRKAPSDIDMKTKGDLKNIILRVPLSQVNAASLPIALKIALLDIIFQLGLHTQTPTDKWHLKLKWNDISKKKAFQNFLTSVGVDFEKGFGDQYIYSVGKCSEHGDDHPVIKTFNRVDSFTCRKCSAPIIWETINQNIRVDANYRAENEVNPENLRWLNDVKHVETLNSRLPKSEQIEAKEEKPDFESMTRNALFKIAKEKGLLSPTKDRGIRKREIIALLNS